MDPRQLTVDSRLAGICAYCGCWPDTSDHVPSKVFLDKPYPPDVPVVDCCDACNKSFADSEQYLACFIECAKQGTTDISRLRRYKIARTFKARPHLPIVIEATRREIGGETVWFPDLTKVRKAIIKLAAGHLFHEFSIPYEGEPEHVTVYPISSMSSFDQESFLRVDISGLWPEIGSRSFNSVTIGGATGFERWRTVQVGSYAYAVGQAHGNWAKMLISDYLACHVAW